MPDPGEPDACDPNEYADMAENLAMIEELNRQVMEEIDNCVSAQEAEIRLKSIKMMAQIENTLKRRAGEL